MLSMPVYTLTTQTAIWRRKAASNAFVLQTAFSLVEGWPPIPQTIFQMELRLAAIASRVTGRPKSLPPAAEVTDGKNRFVRQTDDRLDDVAGAIGAIREQRHEAIYWILQNQLGRRNLDGIAYDLMIARAYEEQMQIRGGDRRSQKVQILQNEEIEKTLSHGNPTADKVASDFGTSSIHVQRARMLQQGLDTAEQVSPGFTNKVLSGEIKAPKTVLRDLRKLPTKATGTV